MQQMMCRWGGKVFTYLPYPYEDELLYSVIARYCLYFNAKASPLSRKLFNKKSIKLRADLPSSLKSVSDKTFHVWQKTSEEILYQLTLFPFYEPFLPTKLRINKRRALLDGTVKSSIGVNTYRVSSPKFLRYCATCSEMDIKEHGETYWHRKHQLPGVLVCTEHGVALIASCALIQPSRTECLDATFVTNEQMKPLESLNITENIIVHKIAERCEEILFQKESKWIRDDLGSVYRIAALERGFFRLPGIFSYKIFEQEFLEFYGIPLLTQLGVMAPGAKNSWIQFIFYNNERQPVHPLEHILVQVFLDHLPVVSSAHPYGLGPWRCPNPYAAHEDNFPIKKIAIRTAKNSTTSASAHCVCGFRFTFSETANGDHQVPIIKKIWSYGPSWKTEAHRLLQNGLRKTEIAKKMSLSRSSVKYLLNAEPKKNPSLDKEVIKARNKWLKILEQIPSKSVTAARSVNYGIYQFLRKHDREWVLSQAEPRKEKLNWMDRDTQWRMLLVEAAEKIKASLPLRRAAKTVIVKEAGLNLRMLNELQRLPSCQKALKELSESSDEFLIRQQRVNNRR